MGHKYDDDDDVTAEQLQAEREKTERNYLPLKAVLMDAYDQAAKGKGRERHADDEPFTQQLLFRILDAVGPGFAVGQAIKKITEAERTGSYQDAVGAITYLAAAAVWLERKGKIQKYGTKGGCNG